MSIVRKVIAAVLSLGLPVAGLCALFVHAHPDDHATAHHDGQAVHAHVAGHRAPSQHAETGQTLEDDDHDRAVYVSAFVAVAVATFSAPEFVATSLELPVPTERAAHRPVDVVHSHDPPSVHSLTSRAPPLFPVLI
jgi:hypothetical protein